MPEHIDISKSAKIEEHTQRLLLSEEEKSEKFANLWRLGISLLLFAVTAGVSKEIPPFSVRVLAIGSTVYFIFSLFIFFWLRAGRYTPKLKYITVSVDIIINTVCMWAFGTYRTFKSEAFLMYYIWIAMATMRLSEKLTLFAGGLSLACYAGLVILALTRGTIETGTISESFISPSVSLGNQALRILYMGIVVVAVTYGARAYRRLARMVHEQEIEIERERMRAQKEEALRKIDEKFKKVIETTSDGYCVTDNQDVVVEVNSAMHAMFGYTPGDMIGRPVAEFLDDENRAAYVANRHRENIHNQRLYELVVMHKDGHNVPVHISATSLFDDHGAETGSFAFLRDISALKATQNELHAMLDKRNRLMREMHHRIKNHLAMSKSLLNLQSRRLGEGESKTAMLDTATRINAISRVHEMLFADEDPGRLDIRRYLDSLIRTVSASYQKDVANIKVHIDVGLEALDIDQLVPVGLIASELVATALKGALNASAGGNVWVSLQQEGDSIVLTVRDDGAGLPEGFDVSSEKSFGIEIVRILVNQLKGKINVSLGAGTLFRIMFPLKELP